MKLENVTVTVSVRFRKLAGCTLFITGASRGIGKAIALKAARDGANIVIAAKTAEPHPKLPGTIYTAAQEGEQAANVDEYAAEYSKHLLWEMIPY